MEPVRLVVWDLDETFWKGTLTEGGIREYVQAHHDIVIELSRRGILNSICSKNDAASVLPILQASGILEYFVFPSISWEPKGPRLADLVSQVQLRPESILFIDDHPGNRAEAAAAVPGLQVESDAIIARILDDPRFRGKDDANLTRLKQYRLLQARAADQKQSAGSNEAFLRSCDIRVLVDYDVESQLDRAIELVNRTNQLNYTKKRLSEDLHHARRELLEQIRGFDRVSGLVRVADRYGDYGYVGFFLTGGMRRQLVEGTANTHLEHFCFSCRTLGMLIEQWTYDHLGRPELDTVGEVLTDLSVPRVVDWVTPVRSMDAERPAIAPTVDRMVIYGGCEAHILAAYLSPYAQHLSVRGNYAASGLFVRIGASAIALDLANRGTSAFAAEAALLGLPLHLESEDLFGSSADAALYVFNFGIDAHGGQRLRHTTEGWQFIIEPGESPGRHLLMYSHEELAAHLKDPGSHYTPEQREHIARVGRHVRELYRPVEPPRLPELVRSVLTLIDQCPPGSRIILIAPHHEYRPHFPDLELQCKDWVAQYRDLLTQVLRHCPFATVVSVSSVIQTPDDIVEADHYARAVYMRLAQRIVGTAAALVPKPPHAVDELAPPTSFATQLGLHQNQLEEFASGETVAALYRIILGREIDSKAYQAECHLTNTIGHWIAGLLGSEEFALRQGGRPRT